MEFKNLEMKNEQERYFTYIDEEGNEELCQIMFMFESEELNKKFVIFGRVSDIEKYYSADDADEDDKIEIGAAILVEKEDGTFELEEIKTEEEWTFIEETLAELDGSSEEHCGCGCGHHHEYCCDDECDCDCDGDCDCDCDGDCDCNCENEDNEEEHCCCCHKHEK